MTIKENPFYILGATTRDNRQKIQELVDEKSLSLDMSVCTEARAVLTNPRRRLSAELAWFPGVSIRQTKTIIKELEDKELSAETLEHLSSLAGVNVVLSYLDSGVKLTAKNLENAIFTLARSYESIKPETVMNVINEDRSISGFPEVTDLSVIQEELTELKNNAMHVLQQAMSSLSLDTSNKIMLHLMERAQKEKASYALLDDVIDQVYVMIVQKDKDSIESNVIEAIKKIENAMDKKATSKATLNKLADELLEELEAFDNIMQPIQLSTQRRGLEHDFTREIAHKVEDLTVAIIKKTRDFALAEKIMKRAKELFVEVGSVNESLSMGLDAINKIQQDDKAFEESIKYKYTKNSFWGGSTTLSLDSKHIVYGDTKYNTDDITHIRYGTTKRYQNGVYMGTDTFVAFGTDETDTRITMLDESEFFKFIDCLMKAVGVRIIQAMVDQLARGKSLYGFIYDDKVKLAKDNAFAPTEFKTFKWSDVMAGMQSGFLIIMAKSDTKYKVTLSLQEIENAPVLGLMLDRFLKLGQNKITEAFKITKEDAQKRKDKAIDFSREISLESYGFIWHWILAIGGVILLIAMMAE